MDKELIAKARPTGPEIATSLIQDGLDAADVVKALTQRGHLAATYDHFISVSIDLYDGAVHPRTEILDISSIIAGSPIRQPSLK